MQRSLHSYSGEPAESTPGAQEVVFPVESGRDRKRSSKAVAGPEGEMGTLPREPRTAETHV